ncbi:hypothetical protein H5410_027788 [Solanum commersonii]|uniref:Uncharacterized protein n=1 Tax=Solanum commersonii TaxID=4109 RepID=A0A9J5Z2W1_SOLCO|nr:hypothetical protein H5410_027788 [Solanum commersonii]
MVVEICLTVSISMEGSNNNKIWHGGQMDDERNLWLPWSKIEQNVRLVMEKSDLRMTSDAHGDTQTSIPSSYIV